MIIMFEGTNEASNDMAETACIASVMSAAKYNKKTLLIQLTNAAEKNVEDLLIGKKKAETEVKLGRYQLEDKGIDALIRRAASSRLTEDGFDATCTQMLAYRHMLDVAGITKKEDFELNITLKEVSTILKNAKKVYNNIILVLNGQDTTIMQEILELADVYVTCFAQKPVIEEYNAFEGVRSLKVVTEYDTASVYSAMYLKKKLKERKIYLIPHNSGYRDACISGTLLTYLLKNINNTHEDDNYIFAKHCTELIEGIMDKEDWSVELPKPVELEEDETGDSTEEPLAKVTTDQYYTEEVEEKKGFFGRRRMVKRVVMDTGMPTTETEPEEKPAVHKSKKEPKKGGILGRKSIRDIVKEEMEESQEDLQEDLINESENGRKEYEPQEELIEDEIEDIEPEASDLYETPEGDMNDSDVAAPVKEERRKWFHDSWFCPKCDAENVGNFCMNCGEKQPEELKVTEDEIEDATWVCPECGTENTGNFCMQCGEKRVITGMQKKMPAPVKMQKKPARTGEPDETEKMEHLTKEYMEAVAKIEKVEDIPVTLPAKHNTAQDDTVSVEKKDGSWVCPMCGELAKGRYCEECGYEET